MEGLSGQAVVKVDGSFGEGGGQILRTTLTLSSILGRPVEVYNIRAKRSSPGLRPQHMAAVKVLAALCGAEVENLRIGAEWIRFHPGEKPAPSLRFDIGSAGSTTLVMTAAIPTAALNGAGCELELIGGTDVRWSPTVNYFKYVVLPAYRLIGVDCTLEVERRGYYPKGGGVVKMQVKPSTRLKAVEITSRKIPRPSVVSVCSRLPRQVAERQADASINELHRHGVKPAGVEISVEEASSPGTSILIYSVGEDGPFLGADSIGERGKPAEAVGREAAELFLKEYSSGAPVDHHMGDMLTTPLFLAEGESKLRVSSVTPHIRTNLHVASSLTGHRYRLEENTDGTTTLTIHGESHLALSRGED